MQYLIHNERRLPGEVLKELVYIYDGSFVPIELLIVLIIGGVCLFFSRSIVHPDYIDLAYFSFQTLYFS